MKHKRGIHKYIRLKVKNWGWRKNKNINVEQIYKDLSDLALSFLAAKTKGRPGWL